MRNPFRKRSGRGAHEVKPQTYAVPPVFRDEIDRVIPSPAAPSENATSDLETAWLMLLQRIGDIQVIDEGSANLLTKSIEASRELAIAQIQQRRLSNRRTAQNTLAPSAHRLAAAQRRVDQLRGAHRELSEQQAFVERHLGRTSKTAEDTTGRTDNDDATR